MSKGCGGGGGEGGVGRVKSFGNSRLRRATTAAGRAAQQTEQQAAKQTMSIRCARAVHCAATSARRERGSQWWAVFGKSGVSREWLAETGPGEVLQYDAATVRLAETAGWPHGPAALTRILRWSCENRRRRPFARLFPTG
jgi:hypothetical protein